MKKSNQVISFEQVYEKYVKNRKIIEQYYGKPVYENGQFQSLYMQGIILSNKYIYAHYGGGCSGNDCNTIYIISPANIIIAEKKW